MICICYIVVQAGVICICYFVARLGHSAILHPQSRLSSGTHQCRLSSQSRLECAQLIGAQTAPSTDPKAMRPGDAGDGGEIPESRLCSPSDGASESESPSCRPGGAALLAAWWAQVLSFSHSLVGSPASVVSWLAQPTRPLLPVSSTGLQMLSM